jgi:hypothetical protein
VPFKFLKAAVGSSSDSERYRHRQKPCQEEAGSMDALHEIMARMTVFDLQRARLASERAKDDELFTILSERLAAVTSDILPSASSVIASS